MTITGRIIVPIDLNAASGARLVKNSLVSPASLADLDQDLVLVELPEGIAIDVSWYPENETPGAYYVTVFRRNQWDNAITLGHANSPEAAALLVQMLAEKHSLPSRAVTRERSIGGPE